MREEAGEWRPAGGEALPVRFADVEEKVRSIGAERITLIRERLAAREVSDLTFRRRFYRTYQKHFLAFYLLFGLGCMLKYFSVLTLRTHHLQLNDLEERGSALVLQALEDKAALIHKRRNVDPHLAALERKYPGITRDLGHDSQSRHWTPFDVRFPISLGLRQSVHGGAFYRRSFTSPAANIVPI